MSVLFGASFLMAFFLPKNVISAWTGREVHWSLRLRHAAFVGTLGVFAAALGGNLENEDEFKIELFCDEET